MNKLILLIGFAAVIIGQASGQATVDGTSTTTATATASINDGLPESWQEAVRSVMDSLLANPTEAIYEGLVEQVAALKGFVDEQLEGVSEARKDAFIGKVVHDIGQVMRRAQASRRKSRVPLKFQIGQVVMGDLLEDFGTFKPKRLSPAMVAQLQVFTEHMSGICRSDPKCNRILN